MTRDYVRKYKPRKTRLSRLDEKRNLKQAWYFGALTIILVIILIFRGLPALINLVVLIGEKRSPAETSEKSDTLAPNPPTFEPFPEATNSANITLNGFAESKSTIKIVLNGEPFKEVQTDEDGEFTVKNMSLKTGNNKIKARTIDQDENQSSFSKIINIILDTENPELEISSPGDGDKFFDKDREITITGSTEPDITIYINDRLAITDSQGNFSINLELKEGDNTITAKAVDLAGNETKKEIKVSYSP